MPHSIQAAAGGMGVMAAVATGAEAGTMEAEAGITAAGTTAAGTMARPVCRSSGSSPAITAGIDHALAAAVDP